MKNLLISEYRRRLALRILIYNIFLIFILIFYYIIEGFNQEEFASTVTLISAVSAIYLGAIFQKIIEKIKVNKVNSNLEKLITPVNQYHQIVAWIIPIHFLLLLVVVSLKAFTVIPFQDMNIFLGIIEGTFGVYMGNLLTTLYEPLGEN